MKSFLNHLKWEQLILFCRSQINVHEIIFKLFCKSTLKLLIVGTLVAMPGVQSSFNVRCDSLHDEMLIKTRGLWATSITWETSSNQWIYLSEVMIIYYKNDPVVQEEENYLLSPNVKKCGLSIWTNLNSLYPGMLFARFGWNWPSGSIEEDFQIFAML